MSPAHIHAGEHAEGLYVPDENVVLYRQRSGTFGSSIYSITDKKELLEELQPLLNGDTPKVETVTYSEIKEFQYDEAKLRDLIQSTKSKMELQNKVETGIEALLKEAK